MYKRKRISKLTSQLLSRVDCHDQENLFRTGATCAGSSIAHDWQISGRVVKELYPDAMTVFVRTLYGKKQKKEAREEDIADMVDYVADLSGGVQDILI